MNNSKESVKRIVVLAPNKPFFGATIVLLPFFQHLRHNFTEAEIVIWSPVESTVLITKLNLADKLYSYNNWKGYLKITSFLWTYKADIVLNLRWYSEGLNLATAFSTARLRVGFKTNSPFVTLFNRKVKYDEDIYLGLRYLDLLKPAGADEFFGFRGILKLDSSSGLYIPADRPVYCLIPAGGEGEHKRWGIENFCALANLIKNVEPDAYFYFVIGPQENEYVGAIKRLLPENSYYILQGGTLGDIVKVAKHAALTVANDCGPAHLAQMCGVNYIGVWGFRKQNPQRRMIEWTIVRPNAVHVLPPLSEDIKELNPADVFKVAKGFLKSETHKQQSPAS